MRRNMMVVLAAVALTGGCGKGAFSANGDVAAVAEGQELKSEWIAGVINGAKGMKPVLRAAEYLADLWVDVSLVAQAAAADELSDSNTIADAMWFRTVQLKLAHFHDSLVSERIKIPESQIDSAIKAQEWRVVQHILVSVPSTATPAEKAAAKKKIDGLLAQIRGGKDMGDLVLENSDDPGSKNTRGFYGAKPKGAYTPEFDKALWELAPGKVSGVVATSYGYHIVRRGNDAENADAMAKLRPEIKDSLVGPQARKLAEDFLAEVAAAADLKITDQAPALVKGALEDLDAKRKDKSKLATYKGGAFTVADLTRWMQVAITDQNTGPGIVDDLKNAPDSVLKGFLTQLASNDLLMLEAEKKKIKLTAEDWKEERAYYLESVDSIKAALRLNDLDPKLSGKARAEAVAAKVDDYFKRIQARDGTRLLAPPGQLAWVLRGRMKVKFYPDGMQKALDLAIAKNTADSIKAMGGGALQPADGPPPVPVGGGKPDTTKGVKKP